jgi:hypothetical protein
MRNTLRVLVIVGVVALLLASAGCTSSNSPSYVRIRVVGVDTVGGVAYLTGSRNYDIEAETFNSNGDRLSQYLNFSDYEWASTNISIASISTTSERLQTDNAGNCTITATLKGEGIVGTLPVTVE